MYDTSGGVAREGWEYALVERQRQGSGQVSDERTLVGLTCAPLSRDTRQQRHRCCMLSRYACYSRVVAPSSPLPLPLTKPPPRSALDASPSLATRPAVLGARDPAGFPLVPSCRGGCDRLVGLIARRAERGAFSEA